MFREDKNSEKVSINGKNEIGKIGKNLNFVGFEAFKLLRTNIMFSFTDTNKNHVIGVTSSIKGEGKSIISLNLAHSLASAGFKVLLLECDMRMPTIAKKLGIKNTHGLSNLLVGLNSGDEAIQRGVLLPNLDVMTSGKIPPNASELIGSNEMKYTIEKLSEYYDYLILDLPPVIGISDALIACKFIDGMIVVVRQNYVKKQELEETMRQLKYIDTKVLGFVLNDVKGLSSQYKKRYYEW